MKAKVIIVSTVCTHPQNSGNRTRLYCLIDLIRELGYDFLYIYLSGNSQTKEQEKEKMKECWGSSFEMPDYQEGYNGILRTENFNPTNRANTKLDDWFDDRVIPELKKNFSLFKPDIVIVSYIMLSKIFSLLAKDTLKIIDTLDILANRAELLKDNNIKDPGWYSCSTEEESFAVKQADRLLAISENESIYYQSKYQKPVFTVGHLKRVDGNIDHGNKLYNNILYLSSAGETNIASLDNFLNNILPKIEETIPDIKITFVGKICNFLDTKKNNFIIKGEVEDLTHIYNSVDLAINCDVFGTGISIKSITALSYGAALVTTKVGARGLSANNAFLIAANNEDFAKSIIEVLSNENLRIKLRNNAKIYANQYYDSQIKNLSSALAT